MKSAYRIHLICELKLRIELEDEMLISFKRILISIIIGLSIFFLLVLINQVNQFAVSAENVIAGD